MNWDEALARVREAAEFCAEAGLARFRIEEGDLAIEVRRFPRGARWTESVVADVPPVLGHTAPATNGSLAHDDLPTAVLKAEFVGIVRLARPAVSEGTRLSEERELAYVESLGIRNPIRWHGAGRVVAVYVTDGQAVEYGQPLFAIEPAP